MDNSTLSKTQNLKYLGVILDHKVSWIQHISYAKNKIAKGIGIMYKARRHLGSKSLVNLYHSYIYPYLIYCIESWGNAAQCHLEPLFKLPKKNIRIITFSDYNAPTEPIFNNLNILPLYKLIHNRIGILMYKYANDMLPPVMNELFIVNSTIHDHNTRQRSKPDCEVCSDRSKGKAGVRRHHTSHFCVDCRVPLCSYPCFQRYHTLVNYKVVCISELHK